MRNILVTGASGFIGSALINRLIEQCPDDAVFGVDIECDDTLHFNRIMNNLDKAKLLGTDYRFRQYDLASLYYAHKIAREFQPDIIVHLAAQPGVRGHENTDYFFCNQAAFFNMINEAAETSDTRLFIYASSSSVYGTSAYTNVALTERMETDEPLSLYAATKKSNEIMAYSYSHLYPLKTVGLRFFSVYGPWGRPDMFYYKATDAMLKGKPIYLYNSGCNYRDCTYIDDVVECIMRVINQEPHSRNLVYNVGCGRPIKTMKMVELLRDELVAARLLPSDYSVDELLICRPTQPEDALFTRADMTSFELDYNYKPQTRFEEGLPKFVQWYKEYHQL